MVLICLAERENTSRPKCSTSPMCQLDGSLKETFRCLCAWEYWPHTAVSGVEAKKKLCHFTPAGLSVSAGNWCLWVLLWGGRSFASPPDAEPKLSCPPEPNCPGPRRAPEGRVCPEWLHQSPCQPEENPADKSTLSEGGREGLHTDVTSKKKL